MNRTQIKLLALVTGSISLSVIVFGLSMVKAEITYPKVQSAHKHELTPMDSVNMGANALLINIEERCEADYLTSDASGDQCVYEHKKGYTIIARNIVVLTANGTKPVPNPILTCIAKTSNVKRNVDWINANACMESLKMPGWDNQSVKK